MNSTIKIEDGVAYVEFKSLLTGATWQSTYAELVSHPDFEPGTPTLWDFRSAEGAAALEAADFSAMNNPVREARKGLAVRPRVAMVTDRDVDFGMARMYEMLSDESLPIEIMVFRDWNAARNWVRGA